ncbi:transposase [Flavonifractor plautii]|nr:transposase [Flavonifractor plautii]
MITARRAIISSPSAQKDKQPLFWQPSVGADIIRPPQGIPLSSIGRVVDEAIRAIPAHYPNVALDKFVVMPNHIHLILALAEPDGRIISAPTKPLSTVIGSMKRAAAKRAGIPPLAEILSRPRHPRRGGLPAHLELH